MGTGSLYLSLDKAWIEENDKKLSDEVKANEDKKGWVFMDDAAPIIIEEIAEDSIYATVKTDIGYVSITIPLGTDDWLSLLTVATKKLNKVKAVLEAVK